MGLPGNATGLPLAGASNFGKSFVTPSRFLVTSPPVLVMSANAPRALTRPPSPSAARPLARAAAVAASAASAPRAAAPAPSTTAPASPAPGINNVLRSKRFSAAPSPGRSHLQSSRCRRDLICCSCVSPASLGLRRALNRLPFHTFFANPVQVAAYPSGSTALHTGRRSPMLTAIPTAPLRTPSFAFSHVSNTVATEFPTASPRKSLSSPRVYFSSLTTRPSMTCIPPFTICSAARASRPKSCSTPLMSWAIFLISSSASPLMINIRSCPRSDKDPSRFSRSRI